MRSVSFTIPADDYYELSHIASVFYEGCSRGVCAMGIHDLARMALLSKRVEMADFLRRPWKPPANMIKGPWLPMVAALRKEKNRLTRCDEFPENAIKGPW